MPVRFIDATCGANCKIACNANERVMNVMAQSANDGYGFHLSDERTALFAGPSKGTVRVTVVCFRR